MVTHYEVLDVATDATDAQIKTAYRRKARTTHPDAGGSADAFTAVQTAYDTLRDPDLRAEYDLTLLRESAEQTAASAGATWGEEVPVEPVPQQPQPHHQARYQTPAQPDSSRPTARFTSDGPGRRDGGQPAYGSGPGTGRSISPTGPHFSPRVRRGEYVNVTYRDWTRGMYIGFGAAVLVSAAAAYVSLGLMTAPWYLFVVLAAAFTAGVLAVAGSPRRKGIYLGFATLATLTVGMGQKALDSGGDVPALWVGLLAVLVVAGWASFAHLAGPIIKNRAIARSRPSNLDLQIEWARLESAQHYGAGYGWVQTVRPGPAGTTILTVIVPGLKGRQKVAVKGVWPKGLWVAVKDGVVIEHARDDAREAAGAPPHDAK